LALPAGLSRYQLADMFRVDHCLRTAFSIRHKRNSFIADAGFGKAKFNPRTYADD
jgi:hypothetical protein